jgi:hypothetical protein
MASKSEDKPSKSTEKNNSSDTAERIVDIKPQGSDELTHEDIEIMLEMKPYLILENSPMDEGLKSSEEPDLHTGDFGDPVALQTNYGWTLNYYLPKEGVPARVAVGRGLSEAAFESSTLLEEQIFYCAAEVIDFLTSQGWTAFKFIEGTHGMSWATFAYLKYKKQKLGGYKPSAEGERKFKQSWHLFEDGKRPNAEHMMGSSMRSGSSVMGTHISGESSDEVEQAEDDE